MAASDYMVGSAPQGASYAAPLVGMQIGQEIASYPQAYMQGRENQRTIALQNAFPNGIPTNQDGSPDVNAITGTIAKIGGGQYVQQLMPFLLNAAQGQKFSQGLTNLNDSVNGGGGAPANTGPKSSSNAGSPSSLAPQPQATADSQPTVMKILAAQGIPNDQLQAAADSVARQLGVGPTDPINPADPQTRNVLGPAIQRLKQAGVGQVVQDGQPPQQPQQVAQIAPQREQEPSDYGTNGNDEGTMQRLRLYAGKIRAAAAGMAATNPAQAQALENQAKAYEDRANEIYKRQSEQQKVLLEHQQSRQDPTGAQKEAAQAGFNSTTAQKKAEEQNKNDVERFGKQYDAISKVGEQADETIPQLDIAKQLVNSKDFYSGQFQQGSDAFKRLSAAFGLDPNAATPDQLFDKIRAGSILNQIKGMAGTGPVRVAEMKFIDQMIAGRDNSPATLRSLIEIERRMYERAQQIRNMANDYNNGHLDTGFMKQVEKFKNEHPMFSKDEMKDWRLISPPVFNSPQELQSAGLKHGDPFKTADGRIKYVP